MPAKICKFVETFLPVDLYSSLHKKILVWTNWHTFCGKLLYWHWEFILKFIFCCKHKRQTCWLRLYHFSQVRKQDIQKGHQSIDEKEYFLLFARIIKVLSALLSIVTEWLSKVNMSKNSRIQNLRRIISKIYWDNEWVLFVWLLNKKWFLT